MIASVLQIIASIVTAVGVVFAGISLRGSQLQRNRQFEALFIARYWKLVDELPPDVALGIRRELQPADRYVVRRYIQLCEDEMEMFARGWITYQTFQEWLPGMRNQLASEPYRTEWQSIVRLIEQEPKDPRPFEYLLKNLPLEETPAREVSKLRLWIRGV